MERPFLRWSFSFSQSVSYVSFTLEGISSPPSPMSHSGRRHGSHFKLWRGALFALQKRWSRVVEGQGHLKKGDFYWGEAIEMKFDFGEWSILEMFTVCQWMCRTFGRPYCNSSTQKTLRQYVAPWVWDEETDVTPSCGVKWLPWHNLNFLLSVGYRSCHECFTRILKKWRETWTVKQKNVGCLGCIMDQKNLLCSIGSIKSPKKNPLTGLPEWKFHDFACHQVVLLLFCCGEKMDVWNMGEHLKRGGLNSNEPIKLGIKVDNPDPMLITHVNMSLMSYCHVGLWLSWLSPNKFWDVWPMRGPKKVHLFPKHCSIWWYTVYYSI